jgi:death on curing protein
LNPLFLNVDEVLELHAVEIAENGGADGLRDRGLLESAIAQPMASFDGALLYQDVFGMAAALHFSLVLNHPFVDGNKRTGLAAALMFLELNGYSVESPYHRLVDITLEVAAATASRMQVADLLRELASPLGQDAQS